MEKEKDEKHEMRDEIERCPRPDGRIPQSGGIEPIGREIYGASECDKDPMAQYTVPDCAYKGYDSYTWPEGRADCRELPHGMKEHQDDSYEEMKPNKR